MRKTIWSAFLAVIALTVLVGGCGFSSAEFDQAVHLAEKDADPAVRQELYIQAEQVLCGTEAAIIPIFHTLYP